MYFYCNVNEITCKQSHDIKTYWRWYIVFHNHWLRKLPECHLQCWNNPIYSHFYVEYNNVQLKKNAVMWLLSWFGPFLFVSRAEIFFFEQDALEIRRPWKGVRSEEFFPKKTLILAFGVIVQYFYIFSPTDIECWYGFFSSTLLSFIWDFGRVFFIKFCWNIFPCCYF